MERWTTEKIYEKTMRYVAPLPSQAIYARNLATIFSMHIHRNELIDAGISPDDLPAPSAIVVAPTGQGKTYLVRKMADVLGLNVITIDCSSLRAEGWKGVTLSQRLAAASKEAKNERAFAQSIIFLDEIDKLKLWGTDYDRGNAMSNILQLYNGGEVAVESDKESIGINTSRFTIILGGAFSGLEDIIRERVCPKKKIGFNAETDSAVDPSTAELMQRATADDLAELGLMPELLGRIGTILAIPPLEVEDYRQLLNAGTGSLRQKYQNYFTRLYGVTFEIAESGVERIAQECMKSKFGARAVNPIVNDMMRCAITAVESQDTVCKVILDAGEDGCFVCYEHGPRIYAPQYMDTRQNKELPWHTIRANNIPALNRKLRRYFQNAGGHPDVLPQLDAFLDCSLTYLYLQCRPSEFIFGSLEKFAGCVYRAGGKSPFDIILHDAKRVIPKEAVEALDLAYTPYMKQNLTDALLVIMNYLWEKHGHCQVRFEIPKKKNAQYSR